MIILNLNNMMSRERGGGHAETTVVDWSKVTDEQLLEFANSLLEWEKFERKYPRRVGESDFAIPNGPAIPRSKAVQEIGLSYNNGQMPPEVRARLETMKRRLSQESDTVVIHKVNPVAGDKIGARERGEKSLEWLDAAVKRAVHDAEFRRVLLERINAATDVLERQK